MQLEKTLYILDIKKQNKSFIEENIMKLENAFRKFMVRDTGNASLAHGIEFLAKLIFSLILVFIKKGILTD